MAFNVPLNNRLAATDASSASAARTWAGYVAKWVQWNYLRTVMGTAAAMSFMLGATHMGGAGS